jgi:hypothetical protein
MKKMTKNQMRLFIIAQVSAGNGFTIDAYGQAPKDGYMSGFNEGELVGANLTQSDIDKWVEKNYPALVHNPRLYAGGWMDNGVYYLEISKHMTSKEQALNYADRYDQKAIWDVESARSIYVQVEQADPIQADPIIVTVTAMYKVRIPVNQPTAKEAVEWLKQNIDLGQLDSMAFEQGVTDIIGYEAQG